jgi:hypothetical protein
VFESIGVRQINWEWIKLYNEKCDLYALLGLLLHDVCSLDE